MALISEGRREVFNYLHRERRCERCKQLYTEHGNFGQWLCKRYHPAENDARGPRGEYTCCGRRVGSTGCVDADHTDSKVTPAYNFEAANRYTFQPDAFALLGDTRDIVNDRAWSKTADGVWVVDRIDIGSALRRLNPLTRAAAYGEMKMARWKPLPRRDGD